MTEEELLKFNEDKFKNKTSNTPNDIFIVIYNLYYLLKSKISSAIDTVKDWVLLQLGSRIGWSSFNDTQYTVDSPFMIPSTQKMTLPNNAANGTSTQQPIGASSFYNPNTLKIMPENNGDYYIVTIRFKAKNTASTNASFDFGMDIGGTQGEIFKETKIFNKGSGVEHDYSIVVPLFTGATFLANGGQVKIKSNAGNISVYDIAYQIVRIHKAR